MIGRIPHRTLQTKRITSVPLADEHLEWEVELDSDPEVMRYLARWQRHRGPRNVYM
jgi:hypothetical protein